MTHPEQDQPEEFEDEQYEVPAQAWESGDSDDAEWDDFYLEIAPESANDDPACLEALLRADGEAQREPVDKAIRDAKASTAKPTPGPNSRRIAREIELEVEAQAQASLTKNAAKNGEAAKKVAAGADSDEERFKLAKKILKGAHDNWLKLVGLSIIIERMAEQSEFAWELAKAALALLF